MKIGILTFHRAHNYGAVLQSYALKKYLQEIGNDVYVIDYNPSFLTGVPYAINNYVYWISINPFKFIRKILSEPLLHFRRKRRWVKFDFFIRSHLNLYPSESFFVNNEFDCVVYGSDQIWNAFITNDKISEVYWGEFSPGKSISFAASMGNYLPTKQNADVIKQYLKNFNSLSVRELSLQNYLKSLTEKTVEVVCDPVFLVSRNNWEQELPSITEPLPYVLCYNLLQSEDCKKQAEIVSKKMGIQLIEISGMVKYRMCKHAYYDTLDPLEFVSYIKQASFVVTSSFHGVVFSVVFQKDFYAIGLGEKSGRVEDLLKQIGLEERMLNNITDNIQNIKNYKDSEFLLNKYVEKSKLFLKRALTAF